MTSGFTGELGWRKSEAKPGKWFVFNSFLDGKGRRLAISRPDHPFVYFDTEEEAKFYIVEQEMGK